MSPTVTVVLPAPLPVAVTTIRGMRALESIARAASGENDPRAVRGDGIEQAAHTASCLEDHLERRWPLCVETLRDLARQIHRCEELKFVRSYHEANARTAHVRAIDSLTGISEHARIN